MISRFHFDDKPKGWRFRAKLTDIFGEPRWHRYTYMGGARQHGYHKDGSWALSNFGGDAAEWSPCWWAHVRGYHKKKTTGLRLDGVLEIREGWE